VHRYESVPSAVVRNGYTGLRGGFGDQPVGAVLAWFTSGIGRSGDRQLGAALADIWPEDAKAVDAFGAFGLKLDESQIVLEKAPGFTPAKQVPVFSAPGEHHQT
jgi:hypothetical protein